MSESDILTIGQQAIYTALITAAPMLIFGLVVGILVSIFQAATQINEQTMVFIPKILAVVAALIIFGPWMAGKLTEFTIILFENINVLVR